MKNFHTFIAFYILIPSNLCSNLEKERIIHYSGNPNPPGHAWNTENGKLPSDKNNNLNRKKKHFLPTFWIKLLQLPCAVHDTSVFIIIFHAEKLYDKNSKGIKRDLRSSVYPMWIYIVVCSNLCGIIFWFFFEPAREYKQNRKSPWSPW